MYRPLSCGCNKKKLPDSRDSPDARFRDNNSPLAEITQQRDLTWNNFNVFQCIYTFVDRSEVTEKEKRQKQHLIIHIYRSCYANVQRQFLSQLLDKVNELQQAYNKIRGTLNSDCAEISRFHARVFAVRVSYDLLVRSLRAKIARETRMRVAHCATVLVSPFSKRRTRFVHSDRAFPRGHWGEGTAGGM
jgi:hypothetical protein